ncbi:MAG: glycosyltransferase family 4 protein [Chloroflexota bacterium]
MKILFVGFVDLARPGGATTHVLELIAALRGLGHEVTLVANASNPVDDLKGFRSIGSYLDAGNQASVLISLCLSLLRGLATVLVAARHVDLIYVRDYLGGAVSWPAAHLFRKPVVYEINGIASDERRAYGEVFFARLYIRYIDWAEGVTVRLANRFVAVTDQLEEYLINRYHVTPLLVAVITNGVNTDMFRPLPEASLNPLREELRLDESSSVIVFAGTLNAWQGVSTLINAISYVVEIFPQAHFLIVGDGPLAGELHELVERLNIKANVTFVGRVPHASIPLYINVADICAAPFTENRNSHCGVSPVKIYEYMACGKPILATRIPGLEFLETAGIGRLAEPGDSISIAEVLVEMLKDDEFRRRASEKATRLAAERHSWEAVAGQVDKICLETVTLK